MTVALRDLDHVEWRHVLGELPTACRDIYFTPEYHNLHEVDGRGAATCSEMRGDGSVLIVPAMRSAVPQSLVEGGRTLAWDLESCNGYGGPIGTPNPSEEFLESAWAAWREDCRKRGIVAAFFRLHPLLRNEDYLPSGARIINDRETVYLDYSASLPELWASADSRFRNMVRKARREDVQIQWNEAEAWHGVAAFYGRAMERLQAPDTLRFSPDYFGTLKSLPGAELASIRRDGRLVAVAVFLVSGRFCHYHVSARDPDAGNHLHSAILQAAIERNAERGLQGMHLGGGRTNLPDDALLRFKRSTGGRLCTFKIALVVADPQGYGRLCAAWQAMVGRAPSWLLGYREPYQAGQHFRRGLTRDGNRQGD